MVVGKNRVKIPTYLSSIDPFLCQSSMITLLKYFLLANPSEINPLFFQKRGAGGKVCLSHREI